MNVNTLQARRLADRHVAGFWHAEDGWLQD